MSLGKIGNRSPRRADLPVTTGAEAEGIPGTGKGALFYHDRSRLPTVSHGEGIWIFDEDGNRYLDGSSGAVTANLGHRHPRIVEAIAEQLGRIAFTYRTQFENRPANELATLLAQLSPPELNRVFFVNSGSEAVEAAIKLARQYWWAVGKQGKYEIISRHPSYHGATLGALAVTGYAPLTIPFRPLLVSCASVAAPFCYHCPLGKRYPECGIDCAHELERKIKAIGKDNVAAFIAEPIGGASTGAAVPPEEYFPLVERICHEHEIVLIIDDVMTGCGRTGTFFGYEHWDVTPDVVASSKGLAAGYTPIGSIVASERIVEAVLECGGFMHGHTFAGNPLSCATTLAVVRTILDEDLVENAGRVGTYLHEQLHRLKARYDVIGDVRGRGLFAGVEFVRDRQAREPFPPNWYVGLEATEIARHQELLIYPRRPLDGLAGDHVLVAPPLIIDEAGVDELILRLDRTLEELTGLLASYLEQEAARVEDRTVKRYEQAEKLPDYALGKLGAVVPVEDANVTAAMETGLTALPPEEVEGGVESS